MSVERKLQKGIGRAFTKITRKFDPYARVFLLKRGSQTEDFAIIKELTSCTLASHDAYRGQLVLSVATADDDFTDEFSQASYVAYGRLDEQDSMEVFVIDADRRDVTQPVGASPLWKLFATKVTNERFTVLVA